MTDSFETRLKDLAQEFDYPATPKIAQQVMRRIRAKRISRFPARKLAWTVTIVLLGFLSLMAVPSVRAAVIDFIQIGIVRIFPSSDQGPTNTPFPATNSSSLMPLLESIAGEMSLEDARQKVTYPIPLPQYPTDLGEPDHVFVQDTGAAMVILVWMDPQDPEQVKLSLHLIPENSWIIQKVHPTVIEVTTVHDQAAAWTTGTYPLVLRNEDIEYARFINGHALIWAEGTITYRLETDLSMREAVKVAESLQTP